VAARTMREAPLGQATEADVGRRPVQQEQGRGESTADVPPRLPDELDAWSLKAVRTSSLAICVAVVAALVPFLYEVYPNLSSSPGFWRDHRTSVVVGWCILVALLVHIITLRQERSQYAHRELVTGIRNTVERAEGAVANLEGSIGRANSVLSTVTGTVSAVGFLAKYAELSRGFGNVLTHSVSMLRVDDEAGFPADYRFMVHLRLSMKDDSDMGLWPAYPPEKILDPAVASASSDRDPLEAELTSQRVLRIARVLDKDSLAGEALVLKEADRSRLRGAERRARSCASVPVFDNRQVPIGTLTAWSPDADRATGSPPTSKFMDSLADLSDDISALAMEALDILRTRGEFQ
jgi:hypothetical protein